MPVIFGRLDAYIARLAELLDLFLSASAFARLEKVEIGGTEASHLPITSLTILSLHVVKTSLAS